MSASQDSSFQCAAPGRYSASGSAARRVLACGLALLLAACQSATYRALEAFGIEKRDILVDRIEDARDAQSEAKEQFASALDQFRSLVKVEGGELERTYDRLNAEYERTRDEAQTVRNRIDAVERVAKDLFAEWEDELEQYSNATMRADSARLLKQTQTRYAGLIKAMRRAESRMQPVLDVLRDNVLSLKHNLNARAIQGLQGELAGIERQTAGLIRDMERAIAEADDFIRGMREQGG